MPEHPPNSQDPETKHARIEALARVRALLHQLGCSDEEIDRAVEDDVIDLLVVDRTLVPTGQRMTQAEVAARTEVPLEVTKRFWRALGFLDVGDAEPAFTEMDIEAVHIFQSMVAMGLVDLDTAVQMARVIGSSMARIAEAEAAPGSTPILVGTGDSIIDADEFAKQAGTSIPAMGRLLEYVWRRHLQVATRRAMLHRTRGPDEGLRPVMAVGFADMVGFTMLSQHLGDVVGVFLGLKLFVLFVELPRVLAVIARTARGLFGCGHLCRSDSWLENAWRRKWLGQFPVFS